jgi:hypothetical protein
MNEPVWFTPIGSDTPLKFDSQEELSDYLDAKFRKEHQPSFRPNYRLSHPNQFGVPFMRKTPHKPPTVEEIREGKRLRKQSQQHRQKIMATTNPYVQMCPKCEGRGILYNNPRKRRNYNIFWLILFCFSVFLVIFLAFFWPFLWLFQGN